jgi:hypothetical protein
MTISMKMERGINASWRCDPLYIPLWEDASLVEGDIIYTVNFLECKKHGLRVGITIVEVKVN